MSGFSLTQRRINLGMFALVIVATLANGLVDLSNLPTLVGSLACSLLAAALLGAYVRGWEGARTVMGLAIAVVIGLAIQEPYVSERFDITLFVPAVVSLVLSTPLVVLASSVGVVLIMLARAGWTGIYTDPSQLVTYAGIVGGMALSRLAVDSAQRIADANARAELARAEAEQRAADLADRNAALQELLAENAAQRDAIRDLSVPLLPIAEHTLVLPLVGVFDAARLQQVRERALATIHERRAHALIIDVTGMPRLDAQNAHGLMALVESAALLGTRVVLVGVRAEVAQTLVGLGIDLGGLAVARDVQAALAYIWRAAPAHG